MTKPKKKKDHSPLAIRFSEKQIEQLDGLAELLSGAAKGVPISRSDALRAAMDKGIEVLTRELTR